MKQRLFVRHYLFFIILLAAVPIALRFQGSSVRAQADDTPSLIVAPPIVALMINNNNEITLELQAANVIDLYSFDVTLAYDPAVVQLDGWALGELVSTFNWKLAEERTPPGHFRLAYSKIGGSPVSGDGVLLELTFSGTNAGDSAITITEAIFVEPIQGEKTFPHLEHGFITVDFYTAQVTGVVFLQGQASRAGLHARLGIGTVYGQGPYDSLSLPNLGANLDFSPVVTGDTYTFATKQPRYLNLARTLTVNDPLALPPLRLLAGDITGDEAVTTADMDAIRSAFGTSGHGLAADLNNDGVVDLRDLALAGGNFGLTAQEAYADWLE